MIKAYVRNFIGRFGGAFRFAGRVGEGEDDRSLVDLAHRANNFLVEGAADSGRS